MTIRVREGAASGHPNRTRRRFGLIPKRLAADTAYGTGRFLAFVTDAGIIPHIPVWDMQPGGPRPFRFHAGE